MPKRSIADRKQAIEMAVRRQIAEVILFNQWVAQQFGMSASDTQFMHLLNLHGPLTPGRLAELSGLSTGTVTGVLDRLEDLGYARRERDPDDRRKVIVTLDEERLWRDFGPLYAPQAEHLAGVLDRYDADQLELIEDFLTRSVEGAPRGGET
jgi:DNA-binding MarR family transcriptional regulator